MDKMPLEIQTLYAEFLERLSVLEAHRSIGHVAGSFITKRIRGDTYYYFQYSVPGGIKKQLYVGRKDAILDQVVERYRRERGTFSEDTVGIQRLSALLRTGGALVTDSASARVLRALSDGSVFRLGGVLIGTHAFVVLGNLLGVRWDGGSLRTQDIDIAAEATISIALTDLQTDVPGVLEGLEMGFLPVPQLDPRKPSTSFVVRGRGLRVDLLTPLLGRRSRGPVRIARLNAAAQPIPFLDFLITRPSRGAIVDQGGILLNVPEPARFAFHKLIISGERDVVMHTKRTKDLRQAAQIFQILVEERPGDVQIAWNEIREKGKGWVRRVRQGFRALAESDHKTGKQVGTALASIASGLDA